MRNYRVFNDVHNVRVIWKLAGTRLGPYGQIAVLVLGALSLVVVMAAGLVPGIATAVVGFVLITIYAVTLSRLDETEKVSERTQIRLLRRGLKHRRTANFDIDGL